jgi:genome maintenance exonuclease 1
MRFYETIDGSGFYPSVTTVLGKTMPEDKANALKKWQEALGHVEANRRSREAADNGTAVHLLIERFLKGEPLYQPGEQKSEKAFAAFNSLKLKLAKIDEVWGLEVPLYSHLLKLAGRCDCIGVYRGRPSIIDFKTAGRLKSEADIEDYKLQLCAYSIMHNELFDTNIEDGVILMAGANGFPQEFRVPLLDYVQPLLDRIDRFYASLSA